MTHGVCFSAGVGRTGTLVAIDIALMRSPEEGVVDIPSILTILRDQRMKMVQTAVSACTDIDMQYTCMQHACTYIFIHVTCMYTGPVRLYP